jgi:hypothetical protein
MSDPEKPRTERRHSFRDSLLLGARCLIHDQGGEGGVEITVKLRNISAQGLWPKRRACQRRMQGSRSNCAILAGWKGALPGCRTIASAFFSPRRLIRAGSAMPVEAQAAPAPMTRRPLGVRLRQIGAMPNALRRV